MTGGAPPDGRSTKRRSTKRYGSTTATTSTAVGSILGGMDRAHHLSALLTAGRDAGRVARRTDLDAPVPPCPDWQVRDLVVHLGGVYRWVHGFVTTGRAEPTSREERAAFSEHPGDGALHDWFDDGFEQVADALARATPELRCWTLLPGRPAREFWTRRMVHETLVHRVDLEIAAGGPPSMVPVELALDGIAELVEDFLPVLAPKRLAGQEPRTLRVVPDDAEVGWMVRLDPADPGAEPGTDGADGTDRAAADLLLRGSAEHLHRLLWQRGPADAAELVTLDGDAEVLDLWRRAARV